MKILFVTTHTPWGASEVFVLQEIVQMKQEGVDIRVVPRNPPKEIFHNDAKKVLNESINIPLMNLRMLTVFFKMLFSNLTLWLIVIKIFIHSRNLLILAKNLVVIPKSCYISAICRDARHIHVHWGGTTSTMGYIISKLNNIPWSCTVHRWDINENNMLKEKVRTAKFIRCISEHGKKEVIDIVGRNFESKVGVIHMGVEIPNRIKMVKSDRERFTIVVPAQLIEVKGHKYLVDALYKLIKKGIKDFQCIFFGEGVLKEELENRIIRAGLSDFVKILGVIPHEKLLQMYDNGEVDVVILSSIDTGKEHEGIPVSLMEAMSYKIPVISTNTGGIPELLSENAGIIVEEKSSEQLANAVMKIMLDNEYAHEISNRGYKKILNDFNIGKNVKTLLSLMFNNNKI